MSRFRRLVLVGVIATTLTVGAVGPAFAIVHGGVPIACADEGSEAGGVGPGGGLPDEAASGKGGPGDVAQGKDHAAPLPCDS